MASGTSGRKRSTRAGRAAVSHVPTQLWVQFLDQTSSKVSTDGCEDVDDFIAAIKRNWSPSLDHVGVRFISLCTTPTGKAVRRSIPLRELWEQPGYTNNSDISPLWITVAKSEATFQYFEWRSTKHHFKTELLNLHNGRLALKPLMQRLSGDVAEVFLIQGLSNKTLEQNDEGFTLEVFQPGEIYQLRVKRRSSADIEISFSDPKLDLFQLRSDFGIRKEHMFWNIDGLMSMIELPSAMITTLNVFLRHNTMRLENSRRFLVSTFLHYAVDAVTPGNSPQCIDEETPLTCIQTRVQDNLTINVRYHGPADIVIGHSRDESLMPEDAAVLIVEVKTGKTLDSAYKQVLAQAATVLTARKKHGRGFDGSGGPVFFIRTSGLDWVLSKMVVEGVGLRVEDSQHFVLLPTNNNSGSFHPDEVQKLFSWLVYIVEQSRDASPRSSRPVSDASASSSISSPFGLMSLAEP